MPTLLLDVVVDELLTLIAGFLPAHSVCAARATCQRLLRIASSDQLWRPLALWLPGMGAAYATAAPADPVPWRAILASWTASHVAHAVDAAAERLQADGKRAHSSQRLTQARLRQTLQRAESARTVRERRSGERQRLLAAHAAWREETHQPSWRLPQREAAPPPCARSIADAQRALDEAARHVLVAEASVLRTKQELRALMGDISRIDGQRRQLVMAASQAHNVARRCAAQVPRGLVAEAVGHRGRCWPVTHQGGGSSSSDPRAM
ncbi:hypothetical protein EMIHUDRAFT_197160 [Emiliania huxleyi CCMP1516]|uniref:F-box domain-containing protein n=3 Tax=Emiliania huxleyi TaxID=2903 RepID=A0A0D3ITT2_EMIH1|nr:hypothetical protein EMIHUDRAFT_197160 [Emiliania huxleyi CCMP1516]EOD14667.1 hypothetical protein EMIHUDRAFT_197160 [Emiliania huxleyi CCMP1516]|eukprot:XP_005767096.1 hypothetical protein EMIHUDRAFT_197160 [Emiliania huxleyi CCMP1516]